MYTPKILQVAQLGDPVLRLKAKKLKIPVTNSAINELALDLVATCRESDGMGIAASQVRQPVRMFVVWSHPNSRYPKAPYMDPIVMVNPGIIRHSEGMEKDWEGCLSIPGIRALVPRWTSVFVHWDGVYGDTARHSMEIDDPFMARVFQHELDHLNGKMFIDRAKSCDFITDKEYLKLMAKK